MEVAQMQTENYSAGPITSIFQGLTSVKPDHERLAVYKQIQSDKDALKRPYKIDIPAMRYERDRFRMPEFKPNERYKGLEKKLKLNEPVRRRVLTADDLLFDVLKK